MVPLPEPIFCFRPIEHHNDFKFWLPFSHNWLSRFIPWPMLEIWKWALVPTVVYKSRLQGRPNSRTYNNFACLPRNTYFWNKALLRLFCLWSTQWKYFICNNSPAFCKKLFLVWSAFQLWFTSIKASLFLSTIAKSPPSLQSNFLPTLLICPNILIAAISHPISLSLLLPLCQRT